MRTNVIFQRGINRFGVIFDTLGSYHLVVYCLFFAVIFEVYSTPKKWNEYRCFYSFKREVTKERKSSCVSIYSGRPDGEKSKSLPRFQFSI